MRLILGDCLESIREIPDSSVDLLVTDPPYRGHFANGGGVFGDRQYFRKVNETVGSSESFQVMPFIEAIRPKMKKWNAYIWGSKDQVVEIGSFALKEGYSFDILTWAKSNPVPTCCNKYLPDTEYCVFTHEVGTTWNMGLPYDYYRKVFNTQVNKSSWGHPNEKPLEVIQPSIAISSNRGDTILDPFMGSGTTGVASKLQGRHFIGIEVNPIYFEIARDRIGKGLVQRLLSEGVPS